MKHTQAPREFIEEYYVADLDERDSPESKWFLSRLKQVKGEKVLSLGCGPNLYDDALFFNEIPKTLIGVDINKNNIEFLKSSNNLELVKCYRALQDKGTEIKLRADNILRFVPKWENYFDSVYAMGVLGMLNKHDMENMLQIVKRYLKSPGIFLDIDWTDCRLSKEKYVERESYDWYSDQGTDILEIENLMKNAGFNIQMNEIYEVRQPQEYGWGKIYSICATK